MSEDHASKTKGLMWVIVASLVALLFIYGIAPLAHLVPWSTEKKMASLFNSTIPADKEVKDAKTQAVLTKMVNRIYPLKADDHHFSVDVHIVKSPVVNAYTELGGRIVLNTGLIKQAKSPEEIEAVIAHEMEHVRHRHIMEGLFSSLVSFQLMQMIFTGTDSSVSSISRLIFEMKFTRGEEAQADKGALERLQQAHVDNRGFKDFFQRMAKQSSSSMSFLSDHPSDEDRVQMAEQYQNKNVTPVLSADEWKILQKSAADTPDN